MWNWRAGRFEGGWVIEMAIPFRSLRYRAGRDQTWGIQLRRTIRHKGENTYLTAMSPAVWRQRRAHPLVDAFPRSSGLEAPPPGRNLEIKPYAISDLRTDRLARPAFSNDLGADVGIDAKYGVTKGLTLDLTYNTDFAQVEDDEAQVNLSRFSLFFPEKREFFLEGQGIFAFGGPGNQPGRQSSASVTPTLFFSRRIGLPAAARCPSSAAAGCRAGPGRYTIGAHQHRIRRGGRPAGRADELQRDAAEAGRLRAQQRSARIVTHRSNAVAGNGSNVVYGADAQFAHQFLNVNAYLAKSETPGLRGDDLSYRTQLDYNADRYGLELERLVVGDNFNPEIGFMRRENFRRNFAQGALQPAAEAGATLIRKYTYEGSFEYNTDNRNCARVARDARRRSGSTSRAATPRQVEHTQTLEQHRRPFIDLGVGQSSACRSARYEFDNTMAQYHARRAAPAGGHGDVRDRHLLRRHQEDGQLHRTAGGNGPLRHRADHLVQLARPAQRTRILTKLVSTRTTYTMTPRMYMSALIQYSSTTTALSSSVRFRWEYIPGSELFVVYSEGRDTFPVRRIDLENRGFVVKINRMLRF